MSLLFKKICRLAGNAISKYDMIQDGDHILIGVSGGKDSLVLLRVLHHFAKIAPVHFTLDAATFDPVFPEFSADITAEWCRQEGIPHHVIRFDMAQLIRDKHAESNPCMLCSRMRRGNLYTLARRLNCNKIALGQHLDDAEISFLMSLCRGAGLSTMGPNVPEQKGKLHVIRPLILTPEAMIAELAQEMDLPIHGECLYKDTVANGDRRYFKKILAEIEERIPDLHSNILRSLSNIQEGYLLDTRFIPNELDPPER